MKRIIEKLAGLMLLATVACGTGERREPSHQVVLPAVEGSWRWISSYGSLLGDTIFAEDAMRILSFGSNGTFRLRNGSAVSASGEYLLYESREPDFGIVPVIEFSTDVRMFSPDKIFMIQSEGDALKLMSPWTDAWHHTFVRVSN